MTLIEQFIARAEGVSARVLRARSDEERRRAVAEEGERARTAGLSFGVAKASRGIASTGTCVVETDDEETRLATMLPDVSIIVLDAADIVPDLPDIAPFLRERQSMRGGEQQTVRATYTSFITGPSRTADIERVSAIGVHGPLELVIILVEG